ncbi:hypothetical protein OROMI_013402 [Orobanche minor]
MNVAEMRMLRWMCGHTKKDRLRNEVIREKVRVASIEDKMMENRLRWFGHVRRRPVDAPVRRLESCGTSNIVKGRGRPKRTWIKLIENDMRFLGIGESMATERINLEKGLASLTKGRVNWWNAADASSGSQMVKQLNGHDHMDKKEIQWKLILHQIGLDVVRTNRTLMFYEKQENLSKLWDILAVYAWFDSDVGYCQEDPRQPFNTKDCGYYVCHFILEIVQNRAFWVSNEVFSVGSYCFYSSSDIDEIGNLWIEYVFEHHQQ